MAVLTTTEIPRPSRGGRPRDPSRDGVIRAAILRLLADVGYGALTMDAVASEAGVGKATIYRRWRTKQDLVVAFRNGPLAVWRDTFQGVWQRAEERGEVRPGLHGSIVAECTSALMVQRWLLTGGPVDDAYADEVLETVVLPLVRA